MSRHLTCLVLSLCCLVGCVMAEEPKPQPKLRVTCTTGMVADAVRQVGGELVEVTALMGPGVDPHLYKASEADIRKLSQADVILSNGLHLEGKLGDVLSRMAKRRTAVALAERIPAERLRHEDGATEGHDPHVWFDLRLWREVVLGVEETLAGKLPDSKELLGSRAAAYLAEINAAHVWARTELANIPAEQRVLVTAHDAFGYFGAAYGVEVHAIQGLSTEDEAGVGEINALIDLIVSRKVKAVFVESSVPRKNIEALIEGCRARQHTVTIGGELFSDALGADGTPEATLLGMFRHNVSTIARALR